MECLSGGDAGGRGVLGNDARRRGGLHRREHLGGVLDRLRQRGPHTQQGVAELLGRAVAAARTLLERLHDDLVERRGDLRDDHARGDRHLVDLPHRDRHGFLAVERHAPGQQLVQHDAHRVAVAGGGDVLAAGLLGRQVLGGADDRPDLGHAGIVAGAGDSEVRDLQVTVLGDEHVLGLDVAVDHVAPVRCGERRQDLERRVDRLAGRQLAALADDLP